MFKGWTGGRRPVHHHLVGHVLCHNQDIEQEQKNEEAVKRKPNKKKYAKTPLKLTGAKKTKVT